MAFYSDAQSYDPFYDRADWYLAFAWLPHTCDKTGERIWLERAYRGIRMITGPGEPVFEYRWIKKHEWLLQRLRGDI
jgi:hypothetical protein